MVNAERDFGVVAHFRPGVIAGFLPIRRSAYVKEALTRCARYAQLYSRVGFVHEFRTLAMEEMRRILTHKWREMGLTLTPDDFTDAEAVAALIRITGGNFRLVQRLCSQIARILEINSRRTVTAEVVEAARESLVIGQLP